MNKQQKRFLSSSVSILLALSLLTACGGPAKNEQSNSTAKSDTSVSAQATGDLNETGYPVVKQKITLKFFAPKAAIHGDYGGMHLFQKMEEVTNIHVEWNTPPTDSFEEKKNLLFASGDLPDAFFQWINRATETTHGADGSFIPLEGLIDKYAPNYKKAMEQFPTLKKNTTSLDGHVYATGIVQDVPRDLTFKEWINKQWIDNLGMKVPTTIDEFYAVMKAFKEKDPNKNGKQDEIPLSAVNLGQTRNFLLSAYGYVSNGVEVKDGKVVFVPMTDGYKEYLKFAQKLYNENLLDHDTFVMKPEQLSAKGNAGTLGCFDHAAPFLAVGADKDAQYIALSPLTSSTNSEKTWLKFADVWTAGFAITKNNKYPAQTMRWLDLLFSDEAKEWQSFGIEGTDWKWEDASKTKWKFTPPAGMDAEQYRGGKVTPAAGLGSIAWWSKDFVLKQDGDPLVSRINEQVDAAQYPKYWREAFPNVYFTGEEQKRLNIINTDLTKYVSEMEAKFITGKESIDNWSKYVDTLKKIGVDEYLKINETAYERWNSMK